MPVRPGAQPRHRRRRPTAPPCIPIMAPIMAKPLHRADPRRYLRPMTHHDISLAGAVVQARPSGALWWAGVGVLAVSDLHLGRAARRARHGGALLPPYEALATLDRLEAEIHALAPRVVISLGDSFDDAGAEARLDTAARARLIALATGRRCPDCGQPRPRPVIPARRASGRAVRSRPRRPGCVPAHRRNRGARGVGPLASQSAVGARAGARVLYVGWRKADFACVRRVCRGP
jgi:hypothetical protein